MFADLTVSLACAISAMSLALTLSSVAVVLKAALRPGRPGPAAGQEFAGQP